MYLYRCVLPCVNTYLEKKSIQVYCVIACVYTSVYNQDKRLLTTLRHLILFGTMTQWR